MSCQHNKSLLSSHCVNLEKVPCLSTSKTIRCIMINQVRVTKRVDGKVENMRDLGRGDYFGEQVMISPGDIFFILYVYDSNIRS